MWTVSATGLVVIVNMAIASAVLVGAGMFLARGQLTSGVPTGRQLVGEWAVDFFIRKARGMADGYDRSRIVGAVTPFLGTFFFLILASNLFVLLPLPVVNRPPTSFFSATLALALCAVIGNLVLAARFKGPVRAAKHLVWPNPMQWVSEFTDVMSLSLRLFGNIGGEYMTLVLVAAVVPVGIPLILHALGLIPSFVQALVFTLLTSSFLAGAIHHEERKSKAARSKSARAGADAAPES